MTQGEAMAATGSALRKIVPHLSAQSRGALEQSFLLDHLDRSETSGASHRVLLVGVMAERLIGGDIQIFAHNDPGQRKNAATEPFAENDDVRNNIKVFESEELARSTKSN